MKLPTTTIAACILFASTSFVPAQQSSPKPPINVPADAKLFNGKWYRVYLEQTTWPIARDKCKTLGGQLAISLDEPTQAFLKDLKPDVGLWLGATDEKLEGVWQWVDGTEMKFKAWAPGEPAGARSENYLFLIHGKWEDHSNGRPQVVGFVCEWKAK